MNYKFNTTGEDLTSCLARSIPDSLRLPPEKDNCITYFHNGDRMDINIETGELVYDTVRPGNAFGSTLAMRLHQWFIKGVIRPVT